jgi:CHAT domain-containing protein
MQLGAILAVVLSTAAVMAMARGIAGWLRRKKSASLIIARGPGAGSVKAEVENIDPAAAARIVELILTNGETDRRHWGMSDQEPAEQKVTGSEPPVEQQWAETAKQAAEEQQRPETARKAAEELQWAEAARLTAEEQQRAEAARLTAEEQQRAEQALEWDEVSRKQDDDRLQSRVIDANLLTERFAPGEIATLTVVLRLPYNPARGKWQSTVALNRERGPVHVILEAQGFTCLSERPAPFEVPEDRDAAPVAFELRIEEASLRWLHIVLIQAGRPVGELTINDFSAMGHGPAQQAASSLFRSVAEADLTLLVRAGDHRIEVCSPRDRAKLDHVTMTGFEYPETPFRNLLADRLRALYDARSDPEETARELRLVGVELAGCLPVDLAKLLRRRDIRSVMLRHEDDFDFPLELCYLDDADDPFFVGDRIAVCRWYLGVTNPPDIIAKRVRKVAFLKGNAEAFKSDEALLNRLYPGRTVTFSRRSEVVEKLFKSSDFDLIHFTGHCRQREQTSGGLELADGTFLRLIEIGQLESERAFAIAQPFVMLNACASAQPYLGLLRRGSFAHRFVTSSACAVVGTLWPVDGSVANEFADHFYAELASKPIGEALLAAKLALVREDATAGKGTSEVPALRRLARQVAVRSYCLFANPDLRLLN